MKQLLAAASFSLLALPAFAQTLDEKARALCGAAADCAVVVITDASPGSDGEALAVVELSYAQPPADLYYEGIECRPYYRQFWLLADGQEPVELLGLCNDGYGASGIGEDEITIGPNSLRHNQVGGSAWRWWSDRSISLSPLKLLTEDFGGYFSLALNHGESHWDWHDFSAGTDSWWAPACLADGSPPDFDQQEEGSPRTSRLIPQLTEGALGEGLGDASLGDCALWIDPAKGEDHLVFGDEDQAAADGDRFAVLLEDPNLLHVTVVSREIMSGGESWLSDDHLEVWQGEWLDYGSACITGQEQARQWAVRIADGEVFPAYGEPSNLPQVLSRTQQQDGEGNQLVTMTIRLAEALEGNTTIAFSKGDGESEQLWMMATSDLLFGQADTLGRRFSISPQSAVCAPVDGKLDIVESGQASIFQP